MNQYPTSEQVEKIKEQYPVGTRIKLLSMDAPYAPIPSGTEGEIVGIDSMGTFLMKWKNGRTLGIVPFEDNFTVISKPQQVLLSEHDIIPESHSHDFTNQVVILKDTRLDMEHRTLQNQLWIATHGPGASRVNSFTRTVHLKHPIDGDIMCVYRSEILGIAKPEVVQKYLTEIEQKQNVGMGGIRL